MISIEDLQYNGLVIAVDKERFSYGRDAVLLANFARPRRNQRALDMGCGTGILSILISGKTGARFTAVDIQEECCELVKESARLNGQEIEVICADIREKSVLPAGSFDCAVCNPPYFSGGTPTEKIERAVSTRQDTLTIQDAAFAAARALKNGGKLWLCYPADRFAECCAALISAGLEPKRARPVMGAHGPYLMLIEAHKGGRTGLVWEAPTEE